MKKLFLLLTVVAITMLSCQNSDCSNGIQDGNETGVDCGGDCIACTTTLGSTEQDMEGMWYFDKKITSFDTTYYSAPACKCQLTLDVIEPTTQYRAYGAFTECTYGSATGWWINSDTDLLNDNFTIDLLNGDSLVITSMQGWGTWYYYR